MLKASHNLGEIFEDFDKTEIDFQVFLDFRFEGKTTFEKVARRASTLSEMNTFSFVFL